MCLGVCVSVIKGLRISIVIVPDVWLSPLLGTLPVTRPVGKEGRNSTFPCPPQKPTQSLTHVTSHHASAINGHLLQHICVILNSCNAFGPSHTFLHSLFNNSIPVRGARNSTFCCACSMSLLMLWKRKKSGENYSLSIS